VEVFSTRAEWRAANDEARRRGGSVGFVPTMGALHVGHRSLVEAARRSCDTTAVSIFVNPLQFSDPEDLERYPRSLSADLTMLEAAGVDLVFTPEVTEIYPRFPVTPETRITVAGPAEGFEGGGRPGHFDGVATVVALLFNLTGPATAFFGEKDFQQLAVVRTMVADLGMAIDVVGCPTLREDDGLAVSSRNARLSVPGRRAATVLSVSLRAGAAMIEAGASAPEAESAMADRVSAVEAATLSYACVVDPTTLRAPSELVASQTYRLLIAAVIDGVRLIDNMGAVAGTAP